PYQRLKILIERIDINMMLATLLPRSGSFNNGLSEINTENQQSVALSLAEIFGQGSYLRGLKMNPSSIHLAWTQLNTQ
ncbi:MAG: hypothetical protein P8144_05970, partial [Gammaproteobacteria bacterium]